MKKLVKAYLVMAIALVFPALSIAQQQLPEIFDRPDITTQPKDLEVRVNSSGSFSVKTYGEFRVYYQWQRHDGGQWVDIENAGKSSYSLSKLQLADDGQEYRCLAYYEGKLDKANVSNVVKTVVYTATKIKEIKFKNASGEYVKQPVVFTADEMEFEIVAEADSRGLTYTWEAKQPGEKTWTEVGDAAVLKVKGADYLDNTQFRCYVETDFDKKPVLSKTVKLRVANVTTATIQDPKAQAFVGKKATMKVKAVGFGSMKYQWQSSLDNSAWDDILKATGTSYSVTTVDDADFDVFYRCKVTNLAGSVESDSFKIIKLAPAAVATSPADATCGTKNSVTFQVVATETSGSAVKYKWLVSTDGGSSWKNAGSSKAELKINNPKIDLNGALYKCQLWNDGNKDNPAESASATLTVVECAKVTTQPKYASSYELSDGVDTPPAHYSVGVDNPSAKYKWEVSFDNGKTWIVVSDQSEFDFVYDATKYGQLKGKSLNYKIRCKVWVAGEDIDAVYTNTVKSVVYAGAHIKSLKAKQGDSTVDLSITGPSETVIYTDFTFQLQIAADGYSNNYRWFKSEDGVSNWVHAGSGATHSVTVKSLVPEKLYYKCMVYNGPSGTVILDESPVVTLVVKKTYTPAALLNGILTLSFQNVVDEEDKAYPLSAIKFGFTSSERGELMPRGSDMSFSSAAGSALRYTYKRINHNKAKLTIQYNWAKKSPGSVAPTNYKFQKLEGYLVFDNVYDQATGTVGGVATMKFMADDNDFELKPEDKSKGFEMPFTFGARDLAPLGPVGTVTDTSLVLTPIAVTVSNARRYYYYLYPAGYGEDTWGFVTYSYGRYGDIVILIVQSTEQTVYYPYETRLVYFFEDMSVPNTLTYTGVSTPLLHESLTLYTATPLDHTTTCPFYINWDPTQPLPEW